MSKGKLSSVLYYILLVFTIEIYVAFFLYYINMWKIWFLNIDSGDLNPFGCWFRTRRTSSYWPESIKYNYYWQQPYLHCHDYDIIHNGMIIRNLKKNNTKNILAYVYIYIFPSTQFYLHATVLVNLCNIREKGQS